MTVAEVRLATRGSRLARAQAEMAGAALRDAGVANTPLVIVETSGDINQTRPAAEMEGQGWFTNEIETALVDGRADCAVHSAKDLPSELVSGLTVAAYLPRADVADALVSRGPTLAELPEGSRVATSSPRRAALARAVNPRIEVVPVRGNVDTRLRKFDEGEFDGLLLAAAGLQRLDLGGRITERLDPRIFVPAPAQGAIALESRDDNGIPEVVAAADDAPTRATVAAERALLVALGGGCLLPLGAWARVEMARLVLVAALPDEQGGIRRIEVVGTLDAPQALGELAAWQLR